jgi:hypothetical protein
MEPGTPTPVLKHGASELPIAWTKRSEALLSQHGYDIESLFAAFANRRKLLFALCVGLYVSLRPEHAPEEPADIAEWFHDDASQIEGLRNLVRIIKHARPELFKKGAEKKSDSTS